VAAAEKKKTQNGICRSGSDSGAPAKSGVAFRDAQDIFYRWQNKTIKTASRWRRQAGCNRKMC
jgi:hypothetical protein